MQRAFSVLTLAINNLFLISVVVFKSSFDLVGCNAIIFMVVRLASIVSIFRALASCAARVFSRAFSASYCNLSAAVAE